MPLRYSRIACKLNKAQHDLTLIVVHMFTERFYNNIGNNNFFLYQLHISGLSTSSVMLIAIVDMQSPVTTKLTARFEAGPYRFDYS